MNTATDCQCVLLDHPLVSCNKEETLLFTDEVQACSTGLSMSVQAFGLYVRENFGRMLT
jgi:hypothetical protein